MTREFLIYLAGASWGVFCGLLGLVAAQWGRERRVAALSLKVHALSAIAEDRIEGRRLA
jgi:hypothetical protein